MIWTASLGNIAFTYACCVDANNCGVPANTGGFISVRTSRRVKSPSQLLPHLHPFRYD